MLKKTTRKKEILIICLLLVLIIGLSITLYISNKKNKEEIKIEETICEKEDGYCIYYYNDKKYYVLNKGYNKEADIEYFNVDRKTENTEEFFNYKYNDYVEFCKKYNITQKYTDNKLNYLVYLYITDPIEALNVKLGDVEYDNNKITLYIWDRKIKGNIYEYSESKKGYAIIVPTNSSLTKHEIVKLLHRTEYNKIAKLYTLDGFTYTKEDNEKLAEPSHIKSNNLKLNIIVNKSLDALSKEHTVKIVTSIEKFNATLTSYVDLIHSVIKNQAGTSALHYTAYADDLRLMYISYAEKDYSHDYSLANRSNLLREIFSLVGDDFIFIPEEYTITITEDYRDYIIESYKSISLGKTYYYINKETYLIEKILTTDRVNTFYYTDENVLLPNDINDNVHDIVYN